jgi:hypothetical protein
VKKIQIAFIALACGALLTGCKKADDATPPAPKTTTTAASTTPEATTVADKTDTSDQPDLTGRWDGVGSDGTKDLIQFAADKSVLDVVDLDTEGVKMKIEMAGTYELTGDKLVEHLKTCNVTGDRVPKDKTDALSKKMNATLPQDEDDTITWSGKDEYTALSPKGTKTTFKREVG